jgi:hypothetical protein
MNMLLCSSLFCNCVCLTFLLFYDLPLQFKLPKRFRIVIVYFMGSPVYFMGSPVHVTVCAVWSRSWKSDCCYACH